jgi:hypothetical protein
MNNNEFNKILWHDSELCNITIDRNNSGNNDQIIIDIRWQNDEITKFIFKDCYELELQMNFGIIASESILKASSTNKSDKLDYIRKKWQQIGVNLDNLNCFEIVMNSTSSVMRIYALNCVRS